MKSHPLAQLWLIIKTDQKRRFVAIKLSNRTVFVKLGNQNEKTEYFIDFQKIKKFELDLLDTIFGAQKYDTFCKNWFGNFYV